MATFESQVHLRWGDMDALGHVNNSVYLELLEEARVRFLLALDYRGGRDFGLVVARHEVDYLKPLVYSADPVTVSTWVERVGTASFTVGYDVRDAAGATVAKAKTVVVSVAADGHGSAPLPDDAKARLAAYLAT